MLNQEILYNLNKVQIFNARGSLVINVKYSLTLINYFL